MKKFQDITKSFTPELYEVILEFDQNNNAIVFLIMEYLDLDLKTFIKYGKMVSEEDIQLKTK